MKSGGARNICCRIPGVVLATILTFTSSGCRNPSGLPHEMRPGVRTGEGFLDREVLVENRRLGPVTDIVVGELDPSPGLEVGTAGVRRVILLKPDGTQLTSMGFKKPYPRMVDVEGDGVCEFFLPGGRATLVDHTGHEIWSAPHPVVRSALGDVTGDGNTDFFLYHFSNLSLMSSTGKVVWSVGPLFNGPHGHVRFHMPSVVHIVDVNKDGRKEIVGMFPDRIVVLDDNGRFLEEKQVRLDCDLTESFLVSYPTKDSPQWYLCGDELRYVLVSLDGEEIAYEFKGVPPSHYPRATLVKLDSAEEPYFAILGLLFWQGRKTFGLKTVCWALCVFDSEQKLVYHEVLSGEGWGLAAMPSTRPNEEVLLVGGKGRVWLYRLAEGTKK